MAMKYLNRRTMLRGMLAGVGVAVALPTLEAMLNTNGDAFANGSGIPQRFMTWFFGNGVILNKFVPAAEGANYPLSEQLQPLANVKDYCSILTGFDNRCEKLITHHEGMTIFNGYTMVQVQGLFSKAGGPTIDQVIASRIAQNTSIPSVHVGVSRRLSIMDSGTTMHNLSHKGTEQPVPPEFNPQTVWNTLFNSFTPPADPAGPLRISVLDAVKENTAALQKRLGVKDNERLESHLDGIATLEKKIKALPPLCMKPNMPTETNPEGVGNEPMTSTSEAMSDLLAYAFACDITRVASYLFIGGAAETVLSELGQNNGHHANTHDYPGAQNEVNAGVIYFMQKLAYMLEKFKATQDGPNGNILDNTIVYCSSDCSEGWTHSVKKQPIILAGKGGGALLYPGIHYNGNSGNPTDVLLTCAQAFDPTITELGAGAPYSNTPCTKIKGT